MHNRMPLTEKIQKAINLAARLHRAHNRIGLDLPYIVHPYSVACLLSQFTDDEDVICAGLLHDVLEDAPNVSFDLLVAEFGERTAKIVAEITEDRTQNHDQSLKSSWHDRKNLYLKGLESASTEALLISAADTVHNLRSLLEAYRLNGDSLWGSFNATIEDKLMFYRRVIETIAFRLPDHVILIPLEEAHKAMISALLRPNRQINNSAFGGKAAYQSY